MWSFGQASFGRIEVGGGGEEQEGSKLGETPAFVAEDVLFLDV